MHQEPSASDSSAPLPQISKSLIALSRGKCGVADSHSACKTPKQQYRATTMQNVADTLRRIAEAELGVTERESPPQDYDATGVNVSDARSML